VEGQTTANRNEGERADPDRIILLTETWSYSGTSVKCIMTQQMALEADSWFIPEKEERF
jgi:hypothetical protein